MERYKNLGQNSSVFAFSMESDSIAVQFTDGWNYLYTYQSAGVNNIEQMKTLALAGRGLSSFIKHHANKAYASKWR